MTTPGHGVLAYLNAEKGPALTPAARNPFSFPSPKAPPACPPAPARRTYATRFSCNDFPDTPEVRRATWGATGIPRDELSAPVLLLNLAPAVHTQGHAGLEETNAGALLPGPAL